MHFRLTVTSRNSDYSIHTMRLYGHFDAVRLYVCEPHDPRVNKLESTINSLEGNEYRIPSLTAS